MTKIINFSSVAQRPTSGLGRLVLEVSRSHTQFQIHTRSH